MEDFIKEYVDMWKRWSDFEGKSNLREFWMSYLINIIVSALISFIGITVLSSLYPLAVFIPSLALGVRRMHDVGNSGLYLLWIFLPIIGWILVLLALIKPSV